MKTESGTGQTTKRNYRFRDDAWGERISRLRVKVPPLSVRAVVLLVVGCGLCLGVVLLGVVFAQSGSVQSGLLRFVGDGNDDDHQRCTCHCRDVNPDQANGFERDRTTSDRKSCWRKSGAASTDGSTQQERERESNTDRDRWTEKERQWLSTTTSPFRFVFHPVRPIVYACAERSSSPFFDPTE